MNDGLTAGRFWTIAAVVGLAAILVPYFLFGQQIEAGAKAFLDSAQGGRLWAAVVLGGLLASDILLPVPSSLVSTACGAVLGAVGGTFVSLVGMTVSSVAGYGIGRGAGIGVVRRFVKSEEMARLQDWHLRFGSWMVVLARPIPVLAEASVVVAGVGRMPLGRFLVVSFISNAAISAAYAVSGAWATRANAFWIAIGLCVLISGVGFLVARKRAVAG